MTEMKVRDLMTHRVFSLNPADTMLAVRNLMWDENIRHVPVVDEERDLVGLVTHRDLLRANSGEEGAPPGCTIPFQLEQTKIAEAMTQDLEVTEPDVDIQDAAQAMVQNKYGCLPVVSGERLIGILTESDFVRLLAEAGS